MKVYAIFDLDGTVSDTQWLQAAWEAALYKERGIEISVEELNERFSGFKLSESAGIISKERGVEFDIQQFLDEKKMLQFHYLRKNRVSAMPGVAEFIKELDLRGIRMAINTSSWGYYAYPVLVQIDLLEFFEAVVTGELVHKGKPDPESFLLLASAMEAKPCQCVVFEDGIAGMLGAKNAGMKCVGIFPSGIKQGIVDLAVNSFTELSCDMVLDLFK